MHLCHVFSTFEPGGTEVRTTEVIRRLPATFEHSILAMDGRYGCRRRVPEERVREWLDGFPTRGRLAALRIAAQLLDRRPDLVLTYNWGAIETVAALGMRGFRAVLHHEESFGADELTSQKRRRVWFRRAVLRLGRGVVVPSRTMQRIARETWRLPARLVHFVPNAVDTDRFAPGDRRAARAALDLPQDAQVVGSVGHLRPEKTYGMLVETFASLRGVGQAWLLLVGGGNERPALEALAAECGVRERIRFTGVLDDPLPAYRVMDVFALSSATEQMPLAVLEAMAVGLPVLATAVGDVAAMVSDANRPWVLPADDCAGYRAGLGALLADAGLRRRIGDANRAHCVKTTSIVAMVEAYRRLYEAAARG